MYQTSQQHAIKIHSAANTFLNELTVYQRLKENDVHTIHGLSVPQFIGHDHGLLVIEMTIVSPPYVLDFGKSRVDNVDDFSEEVWQDWLQQVRERFGTRADDAMGVYWTLQRQWGIYYLDISPYNMNFGDPEVNEAGSDAE